MDTTAAFFVLISVSYSLLNPLRIRLVIFFHIKNMFLNMKQQCNYLQYL